MDMPILAQNSAGTVNYEVSKLSCNTATASYPVNTMHGATTDNVWHLIYSAETQLYPGAATQIIEAINYGSVYYGAFYSGIASGVHSNVNSTAVFIPVDLTGYESITISGLLQTTGSGSYAGFWLANPTQFSNYNQRYPYYTIGQGMTTNMYVLNSRVTSGGSSNAPVTWTVSGYSGTYYIGCGCYCNSGAATFAEAQITSVVGT